MFRSVVPLRYGFRFRSGNVKPGIIERSVKRAGRVASKQLS